MNTPVKPGYKQTEVGVIPEDWEVRCLSTQLLTGPTNGYSGRSGKDSRGTPTLMLSATTSGRMILNHQTIKHLDEALDSRSDVFLKPGDVLVQRSNTVDLVGTTAIFDGPADSFVYPDLMMRMRFKSPHTAHWFWRYANSASGRRHFVAIAAGSTGSMPKISGENLRNMLLPLPPPAEQEAIAEALSDADALIESLEQLIAKTRQVKQGAMQELVTGKRRLPGFERSRAYKQTDIGLIPEDWEAPSLGCILKSVQLGGDYKNSERETNWPLIKMGNLGRGAIDLRTLEFIDPCQPPADRDRLRNGDVLFNTRNSLELVGKVAIWRGELPEAYFNSNIMRLDLDEARVSSKPLMNYMMNTAQVLRSLRQIAIGTTSVAAIYGRDLVTVRIPLPTRAEQEAIAAVINDMGAEIAALDAKLAKARQLKQGMMQELLTGRIRLV